MNSSDLSTQIQNLIAQGEAMRVQLWIAIGVIGIGGILLAYFMRSMWEDQKKAISDHSLLLSVHDKDIAVLKSRHDISDAIKDGMVGISDAITDKNRTLQTLAERRRGQ